MTGVAAMRTGYTAQQEIPIQLINRIINPHVAKRLSTLPGNILLEYETRSGPLA